MADIISILVVEDEFFIQDMLRDALSEAGYRVCCEDSGEAAIERICTAEPHYAAIVTDINLNGSVTGWAVAHEARRRRPDVAIVYMSGESAGEYAAAGVPGSQFLQKPIAPNRITTALSTLLKATNM